MTRMESNKRCQAVQPPYVSSSCNAMSRFSIPASALSNLSEDVESLWCPKTVPVLDGPPSALEFLRNYVSKSVPCIIRHAIPDPNKLWKADNNNPLLLDLDDLVELCDSSQNEKLLLTVDVTPDGHGDCVRAVRLPGGETRRFFVKPQERTMILGEFRNNLRSRQRKQCTSSLEKDIDGRTTYPLTEHHDSDTTSKEVGEDEDVDVVDGENSVFYYSRQNDCLRTEWRSLFDRNIFPQSFDFAEDAFGTGPPDAINLWIGNEDVVSSMHKDHYENLFYVLSGEKVFTLCPPSDAPFLYQGEFDSGVFCEKRSSSKSRSAPSWCVVPEYNEDSSQNGSARSYQKVQWIESDVQPMLSSSMEQRLTVLGRYPLLNHAHPIEVRVKEGEMLYLPSLWYHRVAQTGETVGLNYWYDMHFDSPLWCYYNFLQQLQKEQDNDSRNSNR